MTFTSTPILGGFALPRPTSSEDKNAPVRRSVTLGNGSTRAYSSGVRKVFALSWAKLDEANLASLRAAARVAFTSYRHLDGVTYVVETGEVSAAAIAGTDPVRFAVSIELTEQGTTR